MVFLVIRARSDRGVTGKIRDTMAMLNLTKVNHATILPNEPSYVGTVSYTHLTLPTIYSV